jgi:hypothetical protein
MCDMLIANANGGNISRELEAVYDFGKQQNIKYE